jgi:hypothetical protein
MRRRTPLYQLIEERLDVPLADFVDERRGESVRPPASWRAVAAEITQKTGVEVTHTALRLWFAQEPASAGGGQRG